MAMLKLRVINNGDHVGLMWFPDDGQPIAGCRGFGIERQLTRAPAAPTYIPNRIGFAEHAAPPPAGSEWQWPIQRYLWWDYEVQSGDVVRYRIVPVCGQDAGHLALDEAAASPWSDEQQVSGQDGRNISAFFNRGIIAAQWVTCELDAEAAKQGASKATPRGELMKAIADPANDLRKALGGLLRSKLVELLSDAANGTGHVYAALYELNDPEVLAQLKALGPRCHLLLGNGAFKPPTNDENHVVRADLKAHSQVQVTDRIVTGSHFAHNKFIVFCDANDQALKVWTGSTNATETGLCTQANNGILINDAKVAAAFLDAWTRLKAAGNGYPKPLKDANSQPRSFQVDRDGTDTDKVSVWFAATNHGEDMEQARALINGAQQGLLFLFFNPGAYQQQEDDQTLLQSVLDRHAPGPHQNTGLYIRGVVNQEIKGLTDAPSPGAAAQATPAQPAPAQTDPSATHPVALYTGGTTPPVRLSKDVLVPANVKSQYGQWETELKGASSVMIHSKVVIADPFGDHPVVVTGSHNLGMKASRENDDNLVIIEGNNALAQAYALNIIAIFQEYRWRQYVNAHAADPSAWHGLQDNDTWQNGHLKSDAAELAFWLGGQQPTAAPAVAGV
jgi:phosphatidylserine/phosphatidylglycerophosphate/cardiolipin synthase-like enzyme